MIEALDAGQPPALRSIAFIAIPGGPESLAIDAEHGRAYTNRFAGMTFAIDLVTRKPVSDVKNGCARSLGIALDQRNQRVFIGFAVGEITALAAVGGEPIARQGSGPAPTSSVTTRLANACTPPARANLDSTC
jgi:hypothetical protein